MDQDIKILLISSNENLQNNICSYLERCSIDLELSITGDFESSKKIIREFTPSIVFCDIDIEFLFPIISWLKAYDDILPIAVISDMTKEDIALQAMNSGACDVVMKDRLFRMPLIIKRESYTSKIQREIKKTNQKIYKLNEEIILRSFKNNDNPTSLNFDSGISDTSQSDSEVIKLFMNEIIENIPEILTIKRVSDFRYIYANNSIEGLLGIPREYFIGKTDYDIFPAIHATFYRKKDKELVETNRSIVIDDNFIQNSDGENLLFQTKRVLIYNSNGKPTFIIGISENITESKHDKIELEKSEMRFSRFFQSSPIASSIVRVSDLCVIDVNDSYLDILEQHRNDIIGRRMSDLSIWDNPQQRSELIKRAIYRQPVRDEEVKVRTKSGKTLTLLMSIEFVQTEDAEPWLLFMALDVTKRIEAEKEALQALEKEKELNQMKSRFISMISHEFRTPLTAIMLSTDLLKTYGSTWSNEEREKHFKRIQATVLSMTQLMEKVLTLGHLESGNMEFKPERVDIDAYLKSIADTVEFTFAGDHVIQYSFQGECLNAFADESLLSLIVNNLLTNAAKYSPKGAPIKFDAKCDNKELTFKITDKGIGIPENDLQSIFQTFYRATNVGSTNGYGLGLSIVKKCVDSHYGKIQIESKESIGTTFIVTVPITSKVSTER